MSYVSFDTNLTKFTIMLPMPEKNHNKRAAYQANVQAFYCSARMSVYTKHAQRKELVRQKGC